MSVARSAAAAGVAACLADVFLTDVFFADGFFADGAFTADAFFATVFLEASLDGAAFLPAVFGDFLAAALRDAPCFLAGTASTGTAASALAGAPPIKNASRDFALAIHPGALPNPVHVAPVAGSLYLATPAVARLATSFLEGPVFARAFLEPSDDDVGTRCSTVTPSEDISALTFPTAAAISALAVRLNSASSAAICFRRAVSFDMGRDASVKEMSRQSNSPFTKSFPTRSTGRVKPWLADCLSCDYLFAKAG